MYMCIRSICIYPWLVKGPAKFRWICDVFLSRPTTCCGWWHMRKIVVVGCISLQLGLAILCFPFSTSHTWMLPIHGKQVVYNQHGSMLYLFNLFAACCNRLYNNLLFTAHPIKHQKLFAWNPCLACIYPLFFHLCNWDVPTTFQPGPGGEVPQTEPSRRGGGPGGLHPPGECDVDDGFFWGKCQENHCWWFFEIPRPTTWLDV